MHKGFPQYHPHVWLVFVAKVLIHTLHNTIMQSVLGGSLHKNNTSYLPLGLYHALVNRISIVLMQMTPKMNSIMGLVQVVNWLILGHYSFEMARVEQTPTLVTGK